MDYRITSPILVLRSVAIIVQLGHEVESLTSVLSATSDSPFRG